MGRVELGDGGEHWGRITTLLLRNVYTGYLGVFHSNASSDSVESSRAWEPAFLTEVAVMLMTGPCFGQQRVKE